MEGVSEAKLVDEEDAGTLGGTVGAFFREKVLSLDAEVREGFVEGAAGSEEGLQFGVRIGVLQERAVVVVGGAACEEGDWGFEPDDEAEVAQEGEVTGNGDDAAARGDDGIAATD